jgi:hypothetical protein
MAIVLAQFLFLGGAFFKGGGLAQKCLSISQTTHTVDAFMTFDAHSQLRTMTPTVITKA